MTNEARGQNIDLLFRRHGMSDAQMVTVAKRELVSSTEDEGADIVPATQPDPR